MKKPCPNCSESQQLFCAHSSLPCKRWNRWAAANWNALTRILWQELDPDGSYRAYRSAEKILNDAQKFEKRPSFAAEIEHTLTTILIQTIDSLLEDDDDEEEIPSLEAGGRVPVFDDPVPAAGGRAPAPEAGSRAAAPMAEGRVPGGGDPAPVPGVPGGARHRETIPAAGSHVPGGGDPAPVPGVPGGARNRETIPAAGSHVHGGGDPAPMAESRVHGGGDPTPAAGTPLRLRACRAGDPVSLRLERMMISLLELRPETTDRALFLYPDTYVPATGERGWP